MTQPRYTIHLYDASTENYEKFTNKTPGQAARLWATRKNSFLTATRGEGYRKVVFRAVRRQNGAIELTHRFNGQVVKVVKAEDGKIEMPLMPKSDATIFMVMFAYMLLRE